MNTNKKIMFGIVGIIILAGVFYGGMSYGGNNVRSAINSRSQGFNQSGGNGMMRGARNNGGFTTGQIISKDANSITVQIMNGAPNTTGVQGGSKIVFFSTNTKVTKSVDGTLADLAIGTDVSITGTANTDGSVNAQSVQIRPQSVVK